MREHDNEQLNREMRRPFQIGEFAAHASNVESLANSIERLTWEGQDIADQAAIKLAALDVRRVALTLYRAEWLLGLPTPPPEQPAVPVAPAEPTTNAVERAQQPRVSFAGNLA